MKIENLITAGTILLHFQSWELTSAVIVFFLAHTQLVA